MCKSKYTKKKGGVAMGVERILEVLESVCENENVFKEVFENTLFEEFSLIKEGFGIEGFYFYDYEKNCVVVVAFAFKDDKKNYKKN
jgi:hypothetical protein